MELEFKKKTRDFENSLDDAHLMLRTLYYQNVITQHVHSEVASHLYKAKKNQLSWNDVIESIFDSCKLEGSVYFGQYKVTVVDHTKEDGEQKSK